MKTSVLTDEEAFAMIGDALEARRQCLWVLRCNMEVSDIQSEIYVIAKGKDAFRRWSPQKGGKAHYINVLVNTALIDMMRKASSYRKPLYVRSLEAMEDYQRMTLGEEAAEILRTESRSIFEAEPPESVCSQATSEVWADEFFEMLDRDFTETFGLEAVSPLVGKGYLTLSVLLKHLMAGYSYLDIAEIYKLTRTRLYQLKRYMEGNLRAWVREGDFA